MHAPAGTGRTPALTTAATLALLWAATGSASGEEARTFQAGLTLASDYTFRGISQTQGGVAFQAGVDMALPSGFFGYVWGSNVNFTQPGQSDDGSSHEIDVAIGYAHELKERWEAELQIVRYIFPGIENGQSYDYNEFIGRLIYADHHHVKLAWTDNVDNTGIKSIYYEAGTGFESSADVSIDLLYGFVDLESAYGASYGYLKASVGRPWGRAAVRLDVIETFGSAALLYGRSAARSRVVLSLDFGF